MRIANLATSPAPRRNEPKQYLVLRTFEPADDGYNGGTSYQRYVKTTTPEPGELIYHGDFRRIADEGDGGMYAKTTYYYVPIDPEKITSEVYNGPGGGNVEHF